MFQRPAFALVQFPAVAQAEVDSQPAGNGVDPAGKLGPVAQQPKPPIRADEHLLGDLLSKRRVAEPTPGNGINPAFMALDEFAIAFGITTAHCGYGRLVLLRAGKGAGVDSGNIHQTARQQ